MKIKFYPKELISRMPTFFKKLKYRNNAGFKRAADVRTEYERHNRFPVRSNFSVQQNCVKGV